ncbi:hypothetical protein RIF29_20512 [Crotalaria pallida]|uniref:Uncharacterized protein n=1 Tax=Crotalaria pallida TaxID=3830 RepID=A0AAN9I544_CROPI
MQASTPIPCCGTYLYLMLQNQIVNFVEKKEDVVSLCSEDCLKRKRKGDALRKPIKPIQLRENNFRLLNNKH